MARDFNTLSVSNIGGDLTIVGNVTSKGEINLDGHVEGPEIATARLAERRRCRPEFRALKNRWQGEGC